MPNIKIDYTIEEPGRLDFFLGGDLDYFDRIKFKKWFSTNKDIIKFDDQSKGIGLIKGYGKCEICCDINEEILAKRVIEV